MESLFTSNFFTNNRAKLRALFGASVPMVFAAHNLLQKNSDIPHAFRQDSNFWYLTGLNLPGVILVIDQDNEVLILPEMTPIDEVFGAPPDFAQIISISGITDIRYMQEGLDWLLKRIKKSQHAGILTAPPAYSKQNGFYTNPARRSLARKLRSAAPDIELLDLRQHLMKMRMVKQEPELLAIKQAVDITVKTLKRVEKKSCVSCNFRSNCGCSGGGGPT